MTYTNNDRTLTFLGIVILIVSFACSSLPNSHKALRTGLKEDVAACRDHSRKEQAICRGLGWLLDHPADVNERQGFLEMAGEVHIFHRFYVLSDKPREREFFRRMILSRIDYLLNRHEWRVRHSGEINAYLIFARVMKDLGMQNPEYLRFIEREIVYHDRSYPYATHMNVAIAVSGLIDGLGYTSRIPFRDILRKGTIAWYSGHPDRIPYERFDADPRYMMEFFYMIAHEIFSMANFGDRDPRLFLDEEALQFLQETIPLGISKSIEWSEVDILAELMICARLLQYSDCEEFEEGVRYIIDAQEEDGSFGTSLRAAQMGMSEVTRHVVVMALWALQ